MYSLLKPFLFRLDPERAHHLVLALIGFAGRVPLVVPIVRRWLFVPAKPVEAFGLRFENQVGLAAGYDKDGRGWRGLSMLGFGHIEVGTITPQPQPGNPKPRVFRLPEDQALINRMGFPGLGADYVAGQMRLRKPTGLILGANLGKNKDTPVQEAVGDYLALIPIFAPLAGYVTINVSSPNTAGLRRLQGRAALDELLQAVNLRRQVESQRLGKKVPILVKLAPDLEDAELEDALEVIIRHEMDGVIATNTTLDRAGLRSKLAGETGGLSGRPLTDKSTSMIGKITRWSQGKLPVIGAGGIMSARDAQEKFDAGAVLVQLYTGLIYLGPGLVREILRGQK